MTGHVQFPRRARPAASLEFLADAGLRVADADADVRGRAVRSSGREIGRVDDLLVDATRGEVKFLQVGTGGLFGIGRRHRFVPIEAVSSVEADAVAIDDRIRAGVPRPCYRPRLVDDLGPPGKEGGPIYWSWWGYYMYPPSVPRLLDPGPPSERVDTRSRRLRPVPDGVQAELPPETG